MKNTRKITLLKTITWRMVATATTMLLVFIFTGELSLMLEVGLLEVSLKMLFYYLHERAWSRVTL